GISDYADGHGIKYSGTHQRITNWAKFSDDSRASLFLHILLVLDGGISQRGNLSLFVASCRERVGWRIGGSKRALCSRSAGHRPKQSSDASCTRDVVVRRSSSRSARLLYLCSRECKEYTVQYCVH